MGLGERDGQLHANKLSRILTPPASDSQGYLKYCSWHKDEGKRWALVSLASQRRLGTVLLWHPVAQICPRVDRSFEMTKKTLGWGWLGRNWNTCSCRERPALQDAQEHSK